jgi:hypothetical protein
MIVTLTRQLAQLGEGAPREYQRFRESTSVIEAVMGEL